MKIEFIDNPLKKENYTEKELSSMRKDGMKVDEDGFFDGIGIEIIFDDKSKKGFWLAKSEYDNKDISRESLIRQVVGGINYLINKCWENQ